MNNIIEKNNADTLSRFLFEQCDVRGELVNLQQTYESILENHHYPKAVQELLGELLVSTCLLTATLKFEGSITVQLQGDGPLSLAVINGNHLNQMKGIARVNGVIPENSSLKEMIGNGYIVITIMPEKGERYQGIVALEGETVSQCIENYFKQSEQLKTRLVIKQGVFNNKLYAAGLLLQKLPSKVLENNENEFQHLMVLANTLKPEELFGLEPEALLYRLYHEEEVRLFESVSVEFKCTCSVEKCGETLMALPQSEIDEILQEDGHIDIHCDYCGSHYQFDAVDIENLRKNKINTVTH